MRRASPPVSATTDPQVGILINNVAVNVEAAQYYTSVEPALVRLWRALLRIAAAHPGIPTAYRPALVFGLLDAKHCVNSQYSSIMCACVHTLPCVCGVRCVRTELQIDAIIASNVVATARLTHMVLPKVRKGNAIGRRIRESPPPAPLRHPSRPAALPLTRYARRMHGRARARRRPAAGPLGSCVVLASSVRGSPQHTLLRSSAALTALVVALPPVAASRACSAQMRELRYGVILNLSSIGECGAYNLRAAVPSSTVVCTVA